MKKLLILILALAGIGQAQIVYDGGRSLVADTVRWGDSDDSSSSYNVRGNVVTRDSGTAGAVTMTTDSCSLPVTLSQGTIAPNTKLELSYETRGSSGNTDSTQVVWDMDTRYCKGIGSRLVCESWVPAGRYRGDTSSVIVDRVISLATSSGTTWRPTRQLFDVPGGHQIRLCVDSYKAGSAATDTTFFRRHVIRPSAIRAGGTPPSTVSLEGDIAIEDVGITSIAAGDNNIGNMDVASLPADPLGANADAASATGSISAKLRFIASTGIPITASALPTGAATAANQSTGNTSLGTIAGAVSGTEMQVDVVGALPAGTNAIGKLAANSGVDIGDVDVTSSALPTGAATSTKQSDGSQKTQIVDGSGNVIGATSNALDVNIKSGAGSGGTAMTDDAAFTPGSTSVTPIAGFADETSPDQVNEGDGGAVRMTLFRGLHVNLRDANGDEVSVGGGTQYDEDAAETPGAKLTMAGGVRRDTPASSTATDGDNATLNLSSAGRLWTSATIDAALPAGTNAIGKLAANSGVDIGDVDVASIAAGDNNIGNVDIVSSALPTGASTAANQSTANGHLATLAGAVSGTEVQADILTLPNVTVGTFPDNEPFNVAQWGGNAATAGAGAVAAGTPRTTLASDDPAVVALQIVDDWDESDRAKVNLISGQAGITGGAGAVGASTPRVTHASDDPVTTATQLLDDVVGTVGSAVPAKADYVGAISSGNLTGIIQADASAIINMSTATTTQIVALTSSQKIYITSWDVIAAGTGTLKLVYGTGSNCGTGTTDLTPAYSLVAQSGLTKGSGLGPILVVPASNALCVTTSAAVGMQGTVSYTKF